jgi:hypothetical protein
MDGQRFLKRARQRGLGHWQNRGDGRYWIDHQVLTEDDVLALASATDLTLWNVKLPEGFLGRLPHLDILDIRGGSGTTLDSVRAASTLRALVINQVRGLTDLSAISTLGQLEFLSLYGLPRVTALPDLSGLTKLKRVELGQMRNLGDVAAIAAAPSIEELYLVRRVGVRAEDLRVLRDHPTLRAFDWFWEDVPVSQAEPALDALPLARLNPASPAAWLAEQVPRRSTRTG